MLYSIGIPLIAFSSKQYQLKHGENKLGIEIKFDDNYKTSGNLYIEIAEKSNPRNASYVPSGIYRSDNTWLYVIGDFDTIFVFSKVMLKLIENKYKHVENKYKTSKGFLLLGEDALKFAAKILKPIELGIGGVMI